MNNGTWMPGDIIAADGWSSVQFSSYGECKKGQDIMNEGFNASGYKGKIKGVCQQLDPNVFYLES